MLCWNKYWAAVLFCCWKLTQLFFSDSSPELNVSCWPASFLRGKGSWEIGPIKTGMLMSVPGQLKQKPQMVRAKTKGRSTPMSSAETYFLNTLITGNKVLFCGGYVYLKIIFIKCIPCCSAINSSKVACTPYNNPQMSFSSFPIFWLQLYCQRENQMFLSYHLKLFPVFTFFIYTPIFYPMGTSLLASFPSPSYLPSQQPYEAGYASWWVQGHPAGFLGRAGIGTSGLPHLSLTL